MQGLACPNCGSKISSVCDSRIRKNLKGIKRRRECKNGHRYNTVEVIEYENAFDKKQYDCFNSKKSYLKKILVSLLMELN